MFLSSPNFISIIVANVVAIFTLLTVGVGSSYKLREGSKESKTLIIMMILIGLASILDPIVFLVDGSTGIIKNMNDFAAFNEVYAEYFGKAAPARSCVEVARLPKDVLCEVELVAYKD